MISKNHADQYLSYSSRVNLSKEKKPSTANQENVSFYEAALKIKEIPWSRNPGAAPFNMSTQINLTTSSRIRDTSCSDKKSSASKNSSHYLAQTQSTFQLKNDNRTS